MTITHRLEICIRCKSLIPGKWLEVVDGGISKLEFFGWIFGRGFTKTGMFASVKVRQPLLVSC